MPSCSLVEYPVISGDDLQLLPSSIGCVGTIQRGVCGDRAEGSAVLHILHDVEEASATHRCHAAHDRSLLGLPAEYCGIGQGQQFPIRGQV